MSDVDLYNHLLGSHFTPEIGNHKDLAQCCKELIVNRCDNRKSDFTPKLRFLHLLNKLNTSLTLGFSCLSAKMCGSVYMRLVSYSRCALEGE